ncbi:helix-turn-helix transcriptional regulator [Methylotenera sp.]|uniref:helix-turn-helix domain-containing protein n=1 Tax=Methylotenera sp. TaxID=2051956 RepID=UPI00248766D5|nr:helix-turn-helix transcriptional regulator [Methylotenera sp.]MDI1362684.1 helix-turn-helix transcriptional regulator [Methylotenera sp.]
MDAAKAFGIVVRRLRKEAGLSQELLAEKAYLRRTYISILELGDQQPSLSTIIKVAEGLSMPAHELIAQVEVMISSE